VATNHVQDGQYLRLVVTADPELAPVASGDPVAVGQIAGVALVDSDAAGESTVDTAGVYELAVEGVNGEADSAVAIGDALYYVALGDPPLSKTSTGVLFGHALGTVAEGATATIAVKLK